MGVLNHVERTSGELRKYGGSRMFRSLLRLEKRNYPGLGTRETTSENTTYSKEDGMSRFEGGDLGEHQLQKLVEKIIVH